MTWNIIGNMDIATSLINLTHHKKFDQIELGDQNSIKTKLGGSKSWFLK